MRAPEEAIPLTGEERQKLVEQGDPHLGADRMAIYGNVVSQIGRFEDDHRAVLKGLRKELDDRLAYRRDGPGLTKAAEKPVEVAVRRAAEASTAALEKRLERNLVENSNAAARQTATRMALMGLIPPTKGAMERIAKEVAQGRPEVAGMTLTQRLKVLESNMVARAHEQIRLAGQGRAADYEKKLNAMAGIQRALGTGVGGGPVGGGSTLREQQRLLTSESMQRVQETERRVMEHSGVKFVYWRLSPTHPAHRGHRKEACEYLAEARDSETEQAIIAAGLSPLHLVLDGLYAIGAVPHAPHPFCRCFIEPLAPDAGIAPEVPPPPAPEDDATPPKPDAPGAIVGEVAEDLSALSKGFAPAQLAEAAPLVQVLNALGNRVGETGLALTSADVCALGIDGAARVLADKLSVGKDREQLRVVTAHLIDQSLAQQQELLASLRERRDVALAQIERDRSRILSETTSTRQAEGVHAAFIVEATKAYANIRGLNALERAFATDPNSTLRTATGSTAADIHRRMKEYGLDWKTNDYEVKRAGAKFYAEIRTTGKVVDRLGKETEKVETVRAIKRALVPGADRSAAEIKPRGVREFLPGGIPFTLDHVKGAPPAQQAGLRMVEETGAALMHYAPGLGKTPLVVASISDLFAKGKIQNAIIAPPPSVRQQMVVETLKFNEKDKISFYVPSSAVAVSKVSIRDALLADYETSFAIGKKARALGEHALNPEEHAAYQKLKVDSGKYADDGMARLTIVGVTTKTGAEQFDKHMKGSGAGDLFHIMGHDDLARMKAVIPKHIDYVAIDEVHGLTSAGMGAGSAKAGALPEITGGRIQYKVGLTGTAVRNNMGEMHDLAAWLMPGKLPPKDEFVRQFSNISYTSDVFRESSVKLLRDVLDTRVISVGSPVEARLGSAFNERLTPAEREQYLRRLEMTPAQERRAAGIEKEFEKYKDEQRAARESGKLDGMRTRLEDTRRELDASVAKALGVSVAGYKEHMEVHGVPPPPAKGFEVMSAETKAHVAALEKEADKLTRVVSPESWRDTSHHSNVHGGKWEENAKALEVMRLMQTEKEQGGFKGQPTIIHLERFESIATLQEAMKTLGLRVADYHGGLGPKERGERIAAMNEGRLDVLILTRAGSTGLNVQKASNSTIHFDLPYTFAEVEQRDARNWRNGQKNDVSSYTLLQSDMYTDRRRYQLVDEKRTVLRAVDEALKIDDRTDVSSILKKPELVSYSALVEERGKERANQMLRELCSELGSAITDRGGCPVRPDRMSTAPLRTEPIMGEIKEAHRKAMYEARGQKDKSEP